MDGHVAEQRVRDRRLGSQTATEIWGATSRCRSWGAWPRRASDGRRTLPTVPEIATPGWRASRSTVQCRNVGLTGSKAGAERPTPERKRQPGASGKRWWKVDMPLRYQDFDLPTVREVVGGLDREFYSSDVWQDRRVQAMHEPTPEQEH